MNPMNQKKQLHKRLEKMLKKAEEDLILLKLELEKAIITRVNAENKANSIKKHFNKVMDIDIDKAEEGIIKSTYQIINQDHN